MMMIEHGQIQATLSKAYSRLNFERFCEVINEPTTYGDQPNAYAVEKWDNFCRMSQSMGRLGTLLDTIIDWCQQDA